MTYPGLNISVHGKDDTINSLDFLLGFEWNGGTWHGTRKDISRKLHDDGIKLFPCQLAGLDNLARLYHTLQRVSRFDPRN